MSLIMLFFFSPYRSLPSLSAHRWRC